MAEAGLTHGGFYAHFASKDDLIAAGVERMFEEARQSWVRETGERPPKAALAAYVDFYLSERHRDSRSAGCPLPFLAADAPRLSRNARQSFAAGVADLTGRLSQRLAAVGRTDPEGEARSLLAEMVRELSLARADPDRARSDTILKTSRAAVKARFQLEPETP